MTTYPCRMPVSPQALPALMQSRSPSPFLCAGKLRGRSPTLKELGLRARETVLPIAPRGAAPSPDDIEDASTEDSDIEELAEVPATMADEESPSLEDASPEATGQALPAQQELLATLRVRQKRNGLFWLLMLLPFFMHLRSFA